MNGNQIRTYHYVSLTVYLESAEQKISFSHKARASDSVRSHNDTRDDDVDGGHDDADSRRLDRVDAQRNTVYVRERGGGG